MTNIPLSFDANPTTILAANDMPATNLTAYPHIEHLLYWIQAREAMRLAKESGRPPPWSPDPILRKFRFCNARREHDAVTRWIATNWIAPHADDPDLWHAIALARLCNHPPSLASIGYPIPWPERREHYLQTMAALKVNGENCYDPAYRPPVSPDGIPTAEYHAVHILDPLWELRDHLRPRVGDTLRDFVYRLQRARKLAGWGCFICGQIAADLKHAEPLKSASDWHTFAVSGPGSRRGLNRICGKPTNYNWSETEWFAALTKLREAITPRLEFELDAMNLQNSLCEVDKYLREKLGEGHPKQIYKPRGADGGLPASRRKRRIAVVTAATNTTNTKEAATMTATNGQGGTVVTPSADPRIDQALGIFADLKALEVTPTSQIGTREILSALTVRKPKNNEFVRVKPESEFTLTTILFENRDEGETYLVTPEMRAAMISGLVTRMLALAVNQSGKIFIWPVPVDDEVSRRNEWNESHRAAYQRAKTEWVKMVGDRSEGRYRIYIAEGVLPPPRWPEKSFAELLALAFGTRKIDREDHPIVKAVRGLTV
jgi:5-hmdU DNA kinase-like protein